LSPANC